MSSTTAAEWSIQEIARLSGTTSRTLRHYGSIGLLAPSRIGTNGYRYYDEHALVRLQRILLLRALGLGLPAIAKIVTGGTSDRSALATHLAVLREERHRLDRQIRSVEITISKTEGGEPLIADEMLDGFDHTKYRHEVEERWGEPAYAEGDRWWRSKSETERAEWKATASGLQNDWIAAAEHWVAPDSAEAQKLAGRQAGWLADVPGVPRHGDALSKEYFVGLGEMYVSDVRFAANYGGVTGATFVRNAMAVYADREL